MHTKTADSSLHKDLKNSEKASGRLRGMVYLSNAFSLNMLDINKTMGLMVSRRELEDVKIILENEQWVSAVGHQQTADILTNMLGIQIPVNRQTIKLQKGDTLIVAQYVGERLPEGATTLPEGSRIDFFMVWIV